MYEGMLLLDHPLFNLLFTCSRLDGVKTFLFTTLNICHLVILCSKNSCKISLDSRLGSCRLFTDIFTTYFKFIFSVECVVFLPHLSTFHIKVIY